MQKASGFQVVEDVGQEAVVRLLGRRRFLWGAAGAGFGLLGVGRAWAEVRRDFGNWKEGQAWPGMEEEGLWELAERLRVKHKVPGASVALIKGGKVSAARGLGVLKEGEEAKVSVDSIFQAASISKPVFAIAVMGLVEKGKLELDRPLNDYLSEPWLPDGEFIEEVTARHVLAHSTGWPNWRRGKPLRFKFRPGSDFSYSGEGFVYLQTVVESIVGEPLAPWLQKNLLRPLAMDASGYVWGSSMEGRAVSGHKADGTHDRFRQFSKPRTSHTLLTTASDLAKAVAFMIKPRVQAPWLPSKPMVQQMLEPQIGDKRRPGVVRGLGWAMQENPRFFYHTGSNGGGHRACAIGSVDSQHGVVVLTNSPNGKPFYQELVQTVSGEQAAMQV